MIKFTIFFASLIILLSYLISHTSSASYNIPERKSQYECGFDPFEEKIGVYSRERFFLKFYLIGILFLIFDLETILLYPFTLLFYSSSFLDSFKPFLVFLIFIFILLVGLFYEYRKYIF